MHARMAPRCPLGPVSACCPACPACAPCTLTSPARPRLGCALCRCWPGGNIGHAFVVLSVSSSVDQVVHLGTEPSGQRRLREVVAPSGGTQGSVVETVDVFTTRDGRLVRAERRPCEVEQDCRYHRAPWPTARH